MEPMRLSLIAVQFLMHFQHVTSKDIPHCGFEDTVNITASQQFTNGSYLYEGVIIPPHLVGVYDYEELYEGKREPAAEHIRGCVCQLKRCVKFCCHPKQLRIEQTRECQRELTNELSYSPYVRITLDNSSHVEVHVLDEFVVQAGIPCHSATTLSPTEEKLDKWELFENGTLLRVADKSYMSRRDYCFTPHEINGTHILNPLNCLIEKEEPEALQLPKIIVLISIPFLVATALVYATVPQLRNVPGKCLICYLLSQAIGFTMVFVLTFATDQSKVFCSIVGFIAFYFLVAIFYWLSVICFDLWSNFSVTRSGVQASHQNKRFRRYSLYGWGLPAVMTLITIVCQFADIRYSLKPGIGDKCYWLKPTGTSLLIYFYGPITPLMTFNIVMFALISKKIYRIKKELACIMHSEEQEDMNKQQANVFLFLRLFLIMGVGWILEVIAFIVGSSKIFYITDLYNASQGILIFFVFVLKRNVLSLIKKK